MFEDWIEPKKKVLLQWWRPTYHFTLLFLLHNNGFCLTRDQTNVWVTYAQNKNYNQLQKKPHVIEVINFGKKILEKWKKIVIFMPFFAESDYFSTSHKRSWKIYFIFEMKMKRNRCHTLSFFRSLHNWLKCLFGCVQKATVMHFYEHLSAWQNFHKVNENEKCGFWRTLFYAPLGLVQCFFSLDSFLFSLFLWHFCVMLRKCGALPFISCVGSALSKHIMLHFTTNAHKFMLREPSHTQNIHMHITDINKHVNATIVDVFVNLYFAWMLIQTKEKNLQTKWKKKRTLNVTRRRSSRIERNGGKTEIERE